MVTSATGAVFPSSRAFVATVVPWASDVGPTAIERADALPDGSTGIIRSGQHLGHRAIGRHDVGEGASGVGTDPHGTGPYPRARSSGHGSVVTQEKRARGACREVGRRT